MGNICRKKESDPDSAWKRQNEEQEHNPMYKYVNFVDGGKLLAAYNTGGTAAVEKIAKTELPDFLFNDGEGRLLTKLDNIKWQHRLTAKFTNSTIWETKTDEELLQEYKDDDFIIINDHEACWDLDKRGGVGETPFHLLYLMNKPESLEVAKVLLKLYPKMALDFYEGQEYYGESALHLAIVYGDLEQVKLLIGYGANVNERAMGRFFLPEDQKKRKTKETDYDGYAYYGEYPLAFAACFGHEEIYDFLIDHGADPDLQDSFGNTVLHMVVIADQVNMYKYCVRHHKKPAKTYIENNCKLTPLTLASKLGRQKIFKEMLELGSLEFWRYSNITCSAYPLLALDSIGPKGETNWNSALMIIINGDRDEHLDMLEGGVMRQLLDEKWERFARRRFFQRLVLAFVHLALISGAVYTRPSTDFLAYNEPKDAARFVCELLVILGCILILAMEVVEIGSQGILGFLKNLQHAPAQTLFMISCILILLCIPVRFTKQEMVEDILLIIAVPGSWFFLLFFARSVKLTGPFVTMIYKMCVGDLVRFGAIYTIFLLAFCQAFYFLFQGATDSQGFNNLGDTIMTLFQMTLGEFKYQDFNNTKYAWLTKMVFAVFMILVPILLLNMLIAMMGNTYQMVISKSEKEWRKQWAKIVVVLERSFSKKQLLQFQKEYSARLTGRPVAELAAYSDKEEEDRRALVVIKSSNKTIARRRKAAVIAWKKAGKEVMKQMKRHKKLGITGPLHLTEVHRKHRRRGSHDSMDNYDDDKGHMFSNMLQQLAWEQDIDLTKGQALISDPDLIDKISSTSPEHKIQHFPQNHTPIANGRPRNHTKYVKTPGGTPKQSPKSSNRKFSYNRVSPLSIAQAMAPPTDDSESDIEVSKVVAPKKRDHSKELSKQFSQMSITEISVHDKNEDVHFRGSKPPTKPHKLSWDVPKFERNLKTDDDSASQDGSVGTKSTGSASSSTKVKVKESKSSGSKVSRSRSESSKTPRDRIKEMEDHSKKKSKKENLIEKSVSRTSSTTSLLNLSDCKDSEL
ncbi:transient receptor potential cation channel subfamily V member 5-like [Ylistrum balloti]|uniref:transient receptor potential cation channel subfamily V member 5-like n=1 Tax=Ylistrum balloti TaxID=509963 RepID=UPI002905C009|nr:transient receptor potential cation channel subfamily V member 5-like [Ylistrum balloti]